MLKKSKEYIRDEIEWTVRAEIMNSLPYHITQAADSQISAIVSAIAFGVAHGVSKALDQIYTTEEFEEDLGLTEKK